MHFRTALGASLLLLAACSSEASERAVPQETIDAAAAGVVTYPLALDLYSFNVNAIVVLLMYAVMVGYVRRMAPLFDRRPSVLTTLVLVVGLFFYQSVVMYAAMAALVVCFHKAESFRQLIVALVFRAIEVVAAVVISLIVREGLDYMLANFAGMQMRDMKPLALIDSETSAQKLGQFTEKFVDIVFGANRHFFAVTKWTVYAACLAAVGYTLVRTRDTLCSIPRWKRLVSPLFLVGLLLLASNPYSIVTTAGVLNNRQWGHGGLVFATLAAMSISLVGNVALSRFLAAGCALAMAINGSVVAFEAKRTSGTEALLTNRIVAEIEAVEGYNPRITPVGIIDRLNLYFFDGARRSHGGGLSPRITKSAYSALSEVAGYEFRKPNGNQSARMKKRCDALEAETRYGIFYRVEPFENGVVVCFFTPRNQPRK